jgi:hypothetical protein
MAAAELSAGALSAFVPEALGGGYQDDGIRRLLLDAASEADEALLALALNEVDSLARLGSAAVDRLSPEVLLLCAEAAVKVGPRAPV